MYYFLCTKVINRFQKKKDWKKVNEMIEMKTKKVTGIKKDYKKTRTKKNKKKKRGR